MKIIIILIGILTISPSHSKECETAMYVGEFQVNTYKLIKYKNGKAVCRQPHYSGHMVFSHNCGERFSLRQHLINEGYNLSRKECHELAEGHNANLPPESENGHGRKTILFWRK